MIYEALVEEFLVSIYEAAGAYLCSNDDLRKLSFDNRSIMLRSAADNVCCMSGSFIMQHALLYGLDDFFDRYEHEVRKMYNGYSYFGKKIY